VTTRDTALSLPLDVGELRMALGHLRKEAFALVADGWASSATTPIVSLLTSILATGCSFML
jgi:hypothetical protein